MRGGGRDGIVFGANGYRREIRAFIAAHKFV